MRYFVMFVTAVCISFLLKLKWTKNKSFYKILANYIMVRPFLSKLVFLMFWCHVVFFLFLSSLYLKRPQHKLLVSTRQRLANAAVYLSLTKE